MALKLNQQGHPRVSALLGGMAEWEEAGYPMVYGGDSSVWDGSEAEHLALAPAR